MTAHNKIILQAQFMQVITNWERKLDYQKIKSTNRWEKQTRIRERQCKKETE